MTCGTHTPKKQLGDIKKVIASFCLISTVMHYLTSGLDKKEQLSLDRQDS
jgi:hypothetical protein